MTREVDFGAAKRIVIKIGSSSLTKRGGGIAPAHVDALVDAIAARRAVGQQVVLVSSGAIATGFPVMGLEKRPRDLATKQAAASVGQGVLLAAYTLAFARHDTTVGQVLLTAEDVIRRTQYRNAQRTLDRLLELDVIPIVNENDTVATQEIRLGDNDRLAALVAHLVRADALVLLSDIDGLYDGPPSREGVHRIDLVRGPQDLEGVDIGGIGSAGVGLGGMTTKVEAAGIATAAGIPVFLTRADLVSSVFDGTAPGTTFLPSKNRPSTRLLWLAHASTPRGRLILDDGAVRAVRDKGASLLPAGIVRVEGEFTAGDPVDLFDQNADRVARGLVNFDSTELPDLLGRSTRELAAALGPQYEREVVHRDDLVLMPGR